MANNKPQFVKGVTPFGIAQWPHLNKPDEYKGKLTYKCNVIVPGTDATELVAKIVEETEKSYEETKAKLQEQAKNGKDGPTKAKAKKALEGLTKTLPFVDAVDDDGNETGDIVLKCKANATFTDKKTQVEKSIKISLFDAKNKPLKESIWGGSVLRISYSLIPYYVASANTCGVSIRIEGVQVKDLVSGSGGRSGAAMGFGEVDGYESSDAASDGDDSDSGDDGENAEDPPDF